VKPSPHFREIRRGALGRDAHTVLTVLHLQIGDPAWDWHRLHLLAELAPEHAADPAHRARFRASFGRWMRASHRLLAQVYDVAEDDPPWALLEYVHGPTLAALLDRLSATGRPLPRRFADQIAAYLDEAHAVLAAAELAHGFWAAHIVIDRHELRLVPWAWWDERATTDRDRALLDALRETLFDHAARRGPDSTSASLWDFAIELCGEPKLAWD
jgi:hypothetical protein